jgi:hypothetical protein
MGWAMAIAATGEALVHPFRMGGAMTIGTSGNGAVLLWVATGAGDITMTSRRGGQLLPSRVMAGDTMFRGCSLAVIQGGRPVRLVTEPAVGFGLGRGMGSVTCPARSFSPVAAIVAGGTRKGSVAAWQPLQFCTLGGMAGETHNGDIPFQLYFHRGMRVMTTAAIGQLVMGTPGMAEIAGWDIFLLLRTVSLMAGLAGDRRLMSHALLGDGQTLPDMTFFTIGIAQP